MKKPLLALVALVLLLGSVQACTNFLITPRATTDGSAIITYNADSHTLYGALARYPAADYPPGSMVAVYDWETHEYRGSIPQVAHTYSVVGNMNEAQLTIAETTFGGLTQLANQPGAILDYGSLIYLALQRATTARDAIKVMTSLVAEYGYASEGESFSIADPQEVWLLELIGKGPYEKGAVWVATRVPDGMVGAHANQARTTTFPRNDPNVMFAPDVVTFAQAHGFYPSRADPLLFSFSDVYNPLTFEGARACEARVWSFFNQLTGGMERYLNYAQGYNLTNRMPLFITPNRSLTPPAVQRLMRDHYENTWFDFSSRDVGATAFEAPYRWRPLEWTSARRSYINERATATQQTGFTFVAVLRGWLPPPVGGVLWFGVDDSALAVHAPLYCGITQAPRSLQEPATPAQPGIMTFSFNSAFWVTNLVSNWVYTRYNLMYPEVIQEIEAKEAQFRREAQQTEKRFLKMIQTGPMSEAIAMLTNFSVTTYDQLTADWLQYFTYLFVKYMDGNVKTPSSNPYVPNVGQPGYGPAWSSLIVQQTGDHYLVPSTTPVRAGAQPRPAPPRGRARKL